MTIKTIISTMFALALFAGAGMSLTSTHASLVPAAYASDDPSSDDATLMEAGASCNCGQLTGNWVASPDDSSSDDSSSDDSSSDDSSSDDSSSDDSSPVAGYCVCTPGSGVGAPPTAFQPL